MGLHPVAIRAATCAGLLATATCEFAGAATLNVTDFGAVGDAVQTLANTTSNSTAVTLPPSNQLSGSDVGKLIELFGAGPVTSGANNQDLVATIVAVTNGTNVTISVPTGRTATGVNCTYGTQNAGAFRRVHQCLPGNKHGYRHPAAAICWCRPRCSTATT